MITRRALLAGSLLAWPGVGRLNTLREARSLELQRSLRSLEQRYGGRLGVAVLDSGSMQVVARRGNERFGLCSTFKLLATACTLARVDRGQDSLNRRVMYTADDLVAYSPTTGNNVDDGLTVGELCEAAITLSDNTAGNLLLDSFGGPSALTSYLRTLGDTVTRLDRREPALNDVKSGDPRDTTTPIAMLQTMHKLLLGPTLSAASRLQLTAWLVANKTGDKRLRAGVPNDWRVADKTGSGPRNATHDVAVIWPEHRPSIVVTAYYVDARASDDERNAVLAEVGRVATDT